MQLALEPRACTDQGDEAKGQQPGPQVIDEVSQEQLGSQKPKGISVSRRVGVHSFKRCATRSGAGGDVIRLASSDGAGRPGSSTISAPVTVIRPPSPGSGRYAPEHVIAGARRTLAPFLSPLMERSPVNPGRGRRHQAALDRQFASWARRDPQLAEWLHQAARAANARPGTPEQSLQTRCSIRNLVNYTEVTGR